MTHLEIIMRVNIHYDQNIFIVLKNSNFTYLAKKYVLEFVRKVKMFKASAGLDLIT